MACSWDSYSGAFNSSWNKSELNHLYFSVLKVCHKTELSVVLITVDDKDVWDPFAFLPSNAALSVLLKDAFVQGKVKPTSYL